MKISFNWLKEFVKLPKSLTVEQLASLLTLHTVEVESVVQQQGAFSKVIVGQVLAVLPHPGADRLKLVDVDLGKEKIRVVCGAPNVAANQKVAVALPGAILPNGLELKETVIRGEKSTGMICAEDELGLGPDHEGILVLDKKAKKGQNFAIYLELNDAVLEIDNKSLSNRGDLWGHYGLAREVSAILNKPLADYQEFIKEINHSAGEALEVKVEAKDLCRRYLAWRVKNIKIEESPSWLKNKLLAAGVRPINNIVDATNYVMLESGQPLHAFSADGIERLVIRRAKIDESIETIDGKERLLSDQVLLIASDKEPLAVAGIMGGVNSGIKENTQEIILESATFDPVSIRKTTNFLNLRTEASMRFEKSLDPELAPVAMNRLATIIKTLCPSAEFINQATDVVNFKLEKKIIDFDLSWIKKSLGRDIPRKEVLAILQRLGFQIENSGQKFSVTAPSWRAVKDINIKEDVLEEIARIFGYNNFEADRPAIKISPLPDNPDLLLERKVKNFLARSAAMNEVYNYAFVGENQLLKLNLDFRNHLKLANPISENLNLLRQSLVPNLLNNIIHNQFNFKEFSLFELGRIFLPLSGQFDKNGNDQEKLPYQEKNLGLVIAGQQAQLKNLKGILEALFIYLFNNKNITEFVYLENVPAWAQAESAAIIKVAGKDIGLLAKVDKQVATKINLKIDSVIAEINFAKLKDLYLSWPDRKYQALAKYPSLERDLAFVVDSKIMYNELHQAIINFDSLIVSADLFDVYIGPNLGENLKSLAFHIRYQSSDKTLLTEEADSLQVKLLKYLSDKFNAHLRDF